MNRVFLFIVMMTISSLCFAAVPVPVSKQDALKELDKELAQKKDETKTLKKQVEDIDKALRDNRHALKKVSHSIQDNEAALSDLENKIDENTAEKEALHEQLEQDYKSISHLILARHRVEDVPMAALVLKPGAPLKTAQSALVMQNIMTSLNMRSKRVKENIARYQLLTEQLNKQKKELVSKLAALEEDRQKLAQYVIDKEHLYDRYRSDIKQQQADIARISKQAKTVKDLMARLKEQRDEEERQKKSLAQALYEAPQMLLSGQAQLPISGIIRVGYGQKDHLDADCQGLWIEGRQNSLVVAPMKGRVRFAGHFKGYGNLVILEHPQGYHTLIGGLEKIDVSVGYDMEAGEPLGYLGPVINGQKPRLYFELRRQGKAVNPSEKFAGIS